jgi:ATP-binding cassette, subfamily C, bacterial
MGSRQNPNRSLISTTKRELRGPLTAALTLGVFTNLAVLTLPLYSMQVFDRVLTSRNLTTLVMITLIAAFMLGIYAALDTLRGAILNRASVAVDRALTEPAFNAVFRARLASPATGATRAFRDIGAIREFISGGMAAFLELPFVPLFTILSFMIHPLLGTVALVGTGLIAATALATELATRKPVRAATKHSVEAQRHMSGVLRDAETISALGMRGTMRQMWLNHHEAALAEQAAVSNVTSLLVSVTKFVRLGVQVAIMGVAGSLVIAGAIQPGVLIAATLLIGRALAPVEQAVGSWRRLLAAREAVAKLSELFAVVAPDAQPLELPRPTGRLAVEGVMVAAPGTTRALVKRVSFAIEAGETLAIAGASGSGKSSLVRALAGVWPVLGGAIRLDGATLTQWNPDVLGRYVGYVPQEIALFEGTIAQNIARHDVPDATEVIKAAQLAGIHEAILRLPQGYETTVGLTGETLSGGLRQRVALARALYGDPAIVILDEPNSNLDAAGDDMLTEVLTRLKAMGKTVVVVSHKTALITRADRILLLADGAVQAFGTRDEILKRVGRPRAVPPRAIEAVPSASGAPTAPEVASNAPAAAAA